MWKQAKCTTNSTWWWTTTVDSLRAWCTWAICAALLMKLWILYEKSEQKKICRQTETDTTGTQRMIICCHSGPYCPAISHSLMRRWKVHLRTWPAPSLQRRHSNVQQQPRLFWPATDNWTTDGSFRPLKAEVASFLLKLTIGCEGTQKR